MPAEKRLFGGIMGECHPEKPRIGDREGECLGECGRGGEKSIAGG